MGLSTPSLGITYTYVQIHNGCDIRGFQLPLSGSHSRGSSTQEMPLLLSTPSLGITCPPPPPVHRGEKGTFNSLSRDHVIEGPKSFAARVYTFNSLSRDHLQLCSAQYRESSTKPFNSLSRDHLSPSYRPEAPGHSSDFQLPLSGSLKYFRVRKS